MFASLPRFPFPVCTGCVDLLLKLLLVAVSLMLPVDHMALLLM